MRNVHRELYCRPKGLSSAPRSCHTDTTQVPEPPVSAGTLTPTRGEVSTALRAVPTTCPRPVGTDDQRGEITLGEQFVNPCSATEKAGAQTRGESRLRPPGFQRGREDLQVILAVHVSRRKQKPPGSWGALAPGWKGRTAGAWDSHASGEGVLRTGTAGAEEALRCREKYLYLPHPRFLVPTHQPSPKLQKPHPSLIPLPPQEPPNCNTVHSPTATSPRT